MLTNNWLPLSGLYCYYKSHSCKSRQERYWGGDAKIKMLAPSDATPGLLTTPISKFYIEEGGGDTFKLMALKGRHRVFTILGKLECWKS
jgi:hypothetical protein